MDERTEDINIQFVQLVLSLQAGAMQQMGKIMSPLTGKVERDLDMAKNSIDMLGMLEAKTKGNLTSEEEKLIAHVLYELRLNYVDELKKGAHKSEGEQAKESQEQDSSSGQEPIS